MLYLEPPFHIIDDISVYRDNEDILQYYYMPLYPHLTVKKDEDTGVDIPQIQLIKYRGESGSGGFLNFDVNLGISEEQIQTLKTTIKANDNLDDTPRIAPVPLLDGFVKLMMLGKETNHIDEQPGGTPDSDTETSGPQFVEKMAHYAKPALYGTNQASFSVKLDEEGVVVVEKAMQGEMAPIGIVYALDYMALRNGYKVKVTADWSRVQKHLEESFNVDLHVFSSSVDKVVDELIEERIIDMQIDKLFVTDESTSAMEARMDDAVTQIKSMVLDNFFEPSLEPIEQSSNDTIDDIGRVVKMIVTGGVSENTLFSYKKRDITRIDKKKLNVQMSERTAVIKSIYPQGHLEGLFKTLRNDNVDLSRFVTEVQTDHPWFKRRMVNVIARTDFKADNVESLNVRLDYGDDKKNVVLDATKTEAKIEWLSKIVDGEMLRPVSISYDVHFKDVDALERPSKLSSESQTIEVENFEVRPHDLYNSEPISILALDFPWEQYTSVEVHTNYEDEDNGIKIDDVFMLNVENKEAIWNLFTLNPDKNTYSYKLIYRAVDHRDIETTWKKVKAENITIRDPFPNKRSVTFVPSVNWTEVKHIFIDVLYEDEENSIREQKALSFNESDNLPKDITLQQFKNPEKRIVQYKVTMVFADGRLVEIPTCQTLSGRVFITTQMKGHRIITISPSDFEFKKDKIREIEVSLRYIDEASGLSFKDNYSFKSKEDRIKYFEYDFADSSNSEFEYQLVLHHQNGLKNSKDWLKSNVKELIPKNN